MATRNDTLLACAIAVVISIGMYTFKWDGNVGTFQAAVIVYVPPIPVVYMALQRRAPETRTV